jgi:DNA repair exonuclease SbcCD ATPase subunit
MDDLTELQSRVAAAQERLQQSAEEERRYGLRLNDIVSIVEGSLSRQREEVEKLKGEVLELRTMLGKLSSERDEAKGALIQAHTALSAVQSRLGQREVQNEQLRRMLMELLAAVEGRKPNAVQDVVRRFEGGIQTLIKQEHPQEPEMPSAAPDAGPSRVQSAPAAVRGRLTVVATIAKANETTGQLALAQQAVSEEEQIAHAVAEENSKEPLAEADSELESLSDVAMSEAGDIVAEPDAEPSDAEPSGADKQAAPQEQDLVNALLDAERKLIEAEALGSAANVNSPVAEIIRRISQRTREINEQSPQA